MTRKVRNQIIHGCLLFCNCAKGADMKEETKLSVEEMKNNWISAVVNTMFELMEKSDYCPFPNRKFKGASFTTLDNGTATVNFLFQKEDN